MSSLNVSLSNHAKKYSGYDLPVYGIDNGQFLYIHIPALTCILLSLVAAVTVIVMLCKRQSFRTFFNWTKSERFVVYLAVCDGLFNVCHLMDHLHIVITRDHVDPKSLCAFYGFMLAEFITAQNLIVNIVSINAFVLIYFRKKLSFGAYDYKLLLWTFGLPFCGAVIAGSMDTLGPNGTSCFFDSVKGELANVFFTTVPLLIIFLINSILYVLTWYRIKQEEPRFHNVSGTDAHIIRASHRAARTMSLFVIVFLLQWWALCMYGVWQLVTKNIPQALFQLVTTFSNIGGILNGIVYLVIRKKQKINSEQETDKKSISDIHHTRTKFEEKSNISSGANSNQLWYDYHNVRIIKVATNYLCI